MKRRTWARTNEPRRARPRNTQYAIRNSPITHRASRITAFTLIEIMVVVIVIGILASVIIPQFGTTTFDAKVSAAKGHIAELDSALARFYVHMDRYPTMDEGLKVLVDAPTAEDKNWRGPYITQLRNDPWGVPISTAAPGCIALPATTFGPVAPIWPTVARARARTLATGNSTAAGRIFDEDESKEPQFVAGCKLQVASCRCRSPKRPLPDERFCRPSGTWT